MTKVFCEKKDCKHYLFCPGEQHLDKHQCGAREIQLYNMERVKGLVACFTYEKIEERRT
jgi:hypothetical protein